jgi:hypothetical protein
MKKNSIVLCFCSIAIMVIIAIFVNNINLNGDIKFLILPFYSILSFLSPPAGLALVISSSTALGAININYPGGFLQSIAGVVVLISIVLKRILEKELSYKPIRFTDFTTLSILIIIFTLGFDITEFSVYISYIKNIFSEKYSDQSIYWGAVFSSRWIYFVILGAMAIRSSKELLILIYFIILGGVYQILAIPLAHFSKLYVTVCEMQGSIEGLHALNTNRAEIGYYFALSTALSILLFKLKNINYKLVVILVCLNMLLTFISSSKGPLLSLLIFIPIIIFLLRVEFKKYVITILVGIVFFYSIFQSCNYYNFLRANYFRSISSSLDSRLSLYKNAIQAIQSNHSLNDSSNDKRLKSTDIGASFDVGEFHIDMTGSGSGTHNLFFDVYINHGFFKPALLLSLFFLLLINLFKLTRNSINNEEEVKIIIFFYIILSFIIGVKLCLSTAAHVAMWPGIVIGITHGLIIYLRKLNLRLEKSPRGNRPLEPKG